MNTFDSNIIIKRINKKFQEKKFQDCIELCNQVCHKKLINYNLYKYCYTICENISLKNNLKNIFLGEKKIFSIITINYNNLEGLKKTVNSIRHQKLNELIQFIVVDGFSSDGSLDFIKNNQFLFDISIYGKDRGIYDAMNRGIEFANSYYTIFMNSGDSFYNDDIIFKVHSLIQTQHQSADVLYGSTKWSTGIIWNPADVEQIWKGNIFCHQSVFIKTKLIKEHPFSIENKICADFKQFYELFLKNYFFCDLKFIVSSPEDLGVSADFKSRTIERWKIVREMNNPKIGLGEIDDFYYTFLSTNGKKIGAHGFETNTAMAKINANAKNNIALFFISKININYAIIDFFKNCTFLKYIDNIDNTLNVLFNNLKKLNHFDEKYIYNGLKVFLDSLFSSIINENNYKFILVEINLDQGLNGFISTLDKIYPNVKKIIISDNPLKFDIKNEFLSFNGDDIKSNLKKTISNILNFINISFNSELIDKINIQAQRSITFTETVKHVYSCKKHTIGVVITSYNNSNTIINSIKSVINQSKKPDIIIISDDHSQDDSIVLIENFIKKSGYSNIYLIKRNSNFGVSKNRDFTIRKINTDYITTLDGDDSFEKYKIEAEYEVLNKNPQTIGFSDIKMLTESGEDILDTSDYSYKQIKDSLFMMLSRSCPVPRDMMFPKKLYLETGGFDHRMHIYEDWAFKMKLLLVAGDFNWLHSGTIGTIYDRRNPGLSNRSAIMHAYGQLVALSKNVDFLINYPHALTGGLITVLKNVHNSSIKSAGNNLIRLIELNGFNSIIKNKFIELYNNVKYTENHATSEIKNFFAFK